MNEHINHYKQNQRRNTVLLCCTALLLLITFQSYADIYRCTDQHGRDVFTDHGCPHGEIQRLSKINQIEHKLSSEESTRLKNLERQARKQADQRQKRRDAKIVKIKSARAQRYAKCRAALTGLKRLRDQRRGGYALKQNLDTVEADLKQKKRDNCD